jgi:hypothetical protein
MPHPKLIVATAGMMMIDDDNVDGGIIHIVNRSPQIKNVGFNDGRIVFPPVP